MPKRIVLDVDTGTDDALAILYAVRHPNIDILGISCVSPRRAAASQTTVVVAMSACDRATRTRSAGSGWLARVR
jgi:inosine-uridine nucleoside N-ribohydrolase